MGERAMSLEIQLTMPEIARQAKKAKALKIKLLRIIKIENEFDLTVFSLSPAVTLCKLFSPHKE
jgi:hypothetical protein